MVDGNRRRGEAERSEVMDSVRAVATLYVVKMRGGGTFGWGGSRSSLSGDVLASWVIREKDSRVVQRGNTDQSVLPTYCSREQLGVVRRNGCSARWLDERR